MIREIAENELTELLELYLYLHEESVPELTEHLKSTWNTIMKDKNHHIIVNMIPLISDGTVSISSYIDHVLTEHFKQYGTVIDEMYLEKQRTSTSVSAFVGK